MLTVLFHGPLNSKELSSVKKSISKIREFKSASNIEVIIVTWSTYKTISIEGVDKTLYVDDVNSFTPSGYKPCNVHRIIELARIGVFNASNELIVRLRSDLEIFDFNQLIRICSNRVNKGYFFDRKVIAIDYSSIDPMRFEIQLPYHVCDWLHIGFKSDLLKIFDVPIPPIHFFSRYIDEKRNKELGDYIEAMRSETYLTSFVIRKTFWSNMATENSVSVFQSISSNIRIVKDFEIYNIGKLGIKSVKHPTNNFDPNRLTEFGYRLWDFQSNNTYPKFFRRLLLKRYYNLRFAYQLFFSVKKIIKSVIRHTNKS